MEKFWDEYFKDETLRIGLMYNQEKKKNIELQIEVERLRNKEKRLTNALRRKLSQRHKY